ncbi:50S ribosomal protein L24 [Alicyclobacillus pomorum]|jgi:large subunit ribosomal protein L24|uniref:50S ribosomal protein L24 n=1 Tax=Alicyclobacillus pomorum TaxID=204470 RepID=UPI000403EB61|nr:50S ribosomal protein L24 [Alicyclobacillus pomorum]
MPKLHVKKGDKVVVIAGKDKSKTGTVLAVFPKEQRVIVEGVNIVKRHTKPNPLHPEGGIIEKEAPIHVSNVQLADPKTGQPTRVGYKFLEDGTKVRYAKKSGEVID